MVTCRVWKERKWVPATKMGMEERRARIQRSIRRDSFPLFFPGLHHHFDLSLLSSVLRPGDLREKGYN